MAKYLGASAVVAVGLIVAAMFGRYEIQSSMAANGWTVFRIDRLTGDVESCVVTYAAVPEGKQPSWCSPNAAQISN